MLINDLFSFASEKLRFHTSQYREANQVRQGYRRYEAASKGSKRTEGWDFTTRGPVADQMPALKDLRGLARSFQRNNAYAQRAINVIVNHAIGPGIQPAFAGGGNKKAKKDWTAYANSTYCDFEGLMDMYGLQELVLRTVLESGDALVLKRINPDNPLNPVELQVLESDYLDETKTEPLENGHYVVQGVEFNARGKRVAYWIYWEHPGENVVTTGKQLEPRRVPAESVMHIFEVLRPGQVRGIPAGVAAFVRLKNFDEYQDFQLYKQKVAACFVMTVTPTDSSHTGVNVPTWNDYVPLDRMGPGIIETLPFGAKAEFSQPPASDGNTEFSATELRAIAGAFGVSYEALTNDYSRATFTSSRMAWLEMDRNIKRLQTKVMVVMFCQKSWMWFSEGDIYRIGYRPTPNLIVTWTTPRREMIDPVKETEALEMQVRAGFKSRQNAIREMGEDPDDVHEEIKADMEKSDEIGAKYSSDARYDVQREKKESESGSKPTPKRGTLSEKES